MFDQDTLAPATARPAGVRAAALAAQLMAGTDPDEMFPCACDHSGVKCGQATPITNKVAARSTAVQDLVRCVSCVKEKHFGNIAHTGPRTAAAIEVNYSTLTDEEKAENKQVQKETDDLNFKASFEKWTLSIDELWREATTDDPQVISRLTRLKNKATVRTGLMLVGDNGSGKSWRAYAYVRMALLARHCKPEQVRVGTERELLGEIDVASLSGDQSKTTMLRKLLDPSVRMYLVDDVGEGNQFLNAEHRVALWTALTDRVYVAGGKTTLVITTNKDPALYKLDAFGNRAVNAAGQFLPGEFREWVGEAAFSRIIDAMNGPTVLYNTESEKTPQGSYRKQVEHEREMEYEASLKTPDAGATTGAPVTGQPNPATATPPETGPGIAPVAHH